MSFQDFGRSSGSGSSRTTSRRVSPQVGPQQSSAISSSSTTASTGSAGSAVTSSKMDSTAASLGQISEALNQYQRNVGILEKIVGSLTGSAVRNKSELQLQYKAQIDVIGQLGDKVRRLVQEQKSTSSSSTSSSTTTTTTKTALTKLERDFERVQSRALALQHSVTRQQEQQQAAAFQLQQQQQESQNNNNNNAVEEYQRQMQQQMQQDRLDESIMREREEELRNINRGMHQVNEIYKDLAHIVGSQQEQVDAIETQMEDSRVNAEAGLQQVEKANENFGATQCVIS